jgi:hypothetical protein
MAETGPPHDPSLDALLDLDGQVMVVDPVGAHWVRFTVRRVPVSPDRPHGLSYALALHAGEGELLVCFDHAHPVRPYEYTDAATLLVDFWAEVDAVLKERGVLR